MRFPDLVISEPGKARQKKMPNLFGPHQIDNLFGGKNGAGEQALAKNQQDENRCRAEQQSARPPGSGA
jgi:hypothetical protein